MRVLLAFDKFKDSLTAPAACTAAAEALRTVRPDWTTDACPLADGGEGFAAILTEAAGGSHHAVTVTGPRGAPVRATFGRVRYGRIPEAARRRLELPHAKPDDEVAVVEMAVASGLALLTAAERDPWQATSVGTGELLRAAAQGAVGMLLGVGGSATHDLGLGALARLGFRFLDAEGRAIDPPVPAAWPRIVRIVAPDASPLPPIAIAGDVTNPVLGPRGAAAVYGPQKGLRAEDHARLENETARLAHALAVAGGRSAALDTPGGGAAGGMAFGLLAGLGARIVPGFDLVADWLDVERRLQAADLVITGEGRFDASSLEGKGPGAVARRALELGRPVHLFAGQIAADVARPGLHLHPITPPGTPLAVALVQAPQNLSASVARAFASAS
jgi:glycerate kinase